MWLRATFVCLIHVTRGRKKGQLREKTSDCTCGIIGPLGLFYLLIYVRNRYEAQVCEVSFTGGLWPYKVRIQSRSSRYVLKLCKCRLEIDRKVSKRWQFEADEYILDEITLLMIGGFGRRFDKQQRGLDPFQLERKIVKRGKTIW